MDLIASLFLVGMVDTDDTMNDRRQTTPGVWQKLPTGELKMNCFDHIFKLELWTDHLLVQKQGGVGGAGERPVFCECKKWTSLFK